MSELVLRESSPLSTPTRVQEREVTLKFGDWSEDGHGKSESIRVRLVGNDVSNEALAEARAKAEEKTGIKLERIFNDYEDSQISVDDFVKIVSLGLPLGDSPHVKHSGLYYHLDEPDELEEYFPGEAVQGEDLDALRVVLAFLGYQIPNFSYRVVKEDVILGGYGAVVKSFGYGLFY